MKTLHVILLTMMLFASVLVVSTSAVSAQPKKKLTKENLPAAVLSAFEKSYPNATIKGVGLEKERGKTFYEIESLDGTTSRDLLYAPDGKVQEIEEGIAQDSLPDAVAKALKKHYSTSQIKKVEKIIKGTNITYEIRVQKNNRATEVVIDPSGKIIKSEHVLLKKEKQQSGEKENEEEDND